MHGDLEPDVVQRGVHRPAKRIHVRQVGAQCAGAQRQTLPRSCYRQEHTAKDQKAGSRAGGRTGTGECQPCRPNTTRLHGAPTRRSRPAGSVPTPTLAVVARSTGIAATAIVAHNNHSSGTTTCTGGPVATAV